MRHTLSDSERQELEELDKKYNSVELLFELNDDKAGAVFAGDTVPSELLVYLQNNGYNITEIRECDENYTHEFIVYPENLTSWAERRGGRHDLEGIAEKYDSINLDENVFYTNNVFFSALLGDIQENNYTITEIRERSGYKHEIIVE